MGRGCVAHRQGGEVRPRYESGDHLVLQIDRELQWRPRGVGHCGCHCAIAECPVDIRPSLEVLDIRSLSHLHNSNNNNNKFTLPA